MEPRGKGGILFKLLQIDMLWHSLALNQATYNSAWALHFLDRLGSQNLKLRICCHNAFFECFLDLSIRVGVSISPVYRTSLKLISLFFLTLIFLGFSVCMLLVLIVALFPDWNYILYHSILVKVSPSWLTFMLNDEQGNTFASFSSF